MGVHLTYIRKDGTEQVYEMKRFSTELRLGYMGISQISLEPLSELRSLKVLTLHYNHLTAIDLSPLSSCRNLREIYLRGNRLMQIDLSPLRSLRNLIAIFLNRNKIHAVDLYPLGRCKFLSKVDLSENDIETIDLTPLYGVPSISIHVDEDTKAYTLFSKRCYEQYTNQELLDTTTSFDVPIKVKNVQDIPVIYSALRKCEEEWKKYHLFSEALNLLGLEWVGIPDIDIDKGLSMINKLDGKGKSIEKFRQKMIAQVCKQIDQGKPAILLDIEKARGESCIARRIQRIIENRAHQIENLTLPIIEGTVDLRPLWWTTYGNEILESLGLGLYCEIEDFLKVKDVLMDLGFDARTTKTERFSISESISLPLQDYLCKKVENHSYETKKRTSSDDS